MAKQYKSKSVPPCIVMRMLDMISREGAKDLSEDGGYFYDYVVDDCGSKYIGRMTVKLEVLELIEDEDSFSFWAGEML